MVDLASLVVRLVADTNQYRRGIDNAADDLRRFATDAKLSVGKIAAVAAGAVLAAATSFAALAKHAIDAADELNDLSKATGVSTEGLSELEYAAEQSGTNLEGLTAGLRKLNKAAADAANGSKSAADDFKLIGVSVRDSNGKVKDTEQLLLDVADKFSQYKDGAGKAAAAQALFGKSGTDLIPFLNEGRSGIEALKNEAARLGLTISSDTAKSADEFNDKLGKLQASLGGAVRKIVGDMLPGLLQLVTRFTDLVTQGDQVNGFLDNMAKVFKFVAASAVRVYYFVANLGRQIGALAAIVTQAVKLNFKEAQAIYDQALEDQIKSEQSQNATLAAIYDERKLITEPDKPKEDKKTGGLKDFPEVAAVKDELQEVDITLQKIKLPEDFGKDLEDETQTALERAFAKFNSRKGALQAQKALGRFDDEPELYTKRLKAIETELLAVISEGPPAAKEATQKINEYQLQAARNTQDIIANTFESLATGADISAGSILKSFGAMIVKLAAQAAAANLAGKLFGDAATGEKTGSTGLVGTAISFLGGLVSRDSGGRGRRGQAYMIGTKAQPEAFIPDSAGTFVPAGAAGMQVNNNFTLVAEAPISKRTQLQIAAAAARGVDRASRRNN